MARILTAVAALAVVVLFALAWFAPESVQLLTLHGVVR
jgi:hypothetical protein